MTVYIAIALGGSLGAVCRYWVASSTYAALGVHFPFGTLLVNVSGSLLIGLLSVLLAEKLVVSEELKMALLVGFLGAYTTFSTFALDFLHWIQQGDWSKALVYVLFSVFGSLLGVAAGFYAARFMLR